MICSACAIHKDGFPSESAYLSFEKILAEATHKGDLTEMGELQAGGPFMRMRYLCNRCGRCWELIMPDQAFRGEWREIVCI